MNIRKTEQPRGCLHASDSMCRCIFCLRTRLRVLTDRPVGDLERFLKRRIWFQRQPTLLKKRSVKKVRTDAAAQGMVPLAVACGESLTTSDGANPTVVGDALSVAVEGTAAQADVGRLKLRPSLPRACKKNRTSQLQPTCKLKGKPKPPSECKHVPATAGKQLLWCLQVEHRLPMGSEERQPTRASLP